MFASGYNYVYLPALVLVFIVGLKTRYKYKVSIFRCVFYIVISLVYAFSTAELAGAMYNVILRAKNSEWHQNRAIFGAILLTPFCVIATVLLEKAILRLFSEAPSSTSTTVFQKTGATFTFENTVSVRNTLDMVTPLFLIVLVFVKIHCSLVGCCCGFPCSWGIYSPDLDTTTFPIQIVEGIITILILFSCYYIKQKPFFRRGMAFPLSVSIYCFVRFFLDFFWYYTPEQRDFWLNFTLWQWLCIVVFIVCIIIVVILYKTQPSEPLCRLKPGEWKEQTVSQKRYSKQWQSTKKKYKKKK